MELAGRRPEQPRRIHGARVPNSAEGLLGTRFSWFTFGNFENDLTSSLLVYPSLTESGRVRVDFDISYRQDLFGDLYLRFSFYDQYDSEPPPGANDNDYGTNLAVGWDIWRPFTLCRDLGPAVPQRDRAVEHESSGPESSGSLMK